MTTFLLNFPLLLYSAILHVSSFCQVFNNLAVTTTFFMYGSFIQREYINIIVALMEPDHLSKKFRTKRSVSKREAPYVIYPEILVIVDYDGYRYVMAITILLYFGINEIGTVLGHLKCIMNLNYGTMFLI